MLAALTVKSMRVSCARRRRRAGLLPADEPPSPLLPAGEPPSRCPCQRPYDVNGDHILTCCHHKATRTRCHNHILACLVSLFRQAGFLADSKNVPRIQRPQDKYYVADMFSRNMCIGNLR